MIALPGLEPVLTAGTRREPAGRPPEPYLSVVIPAYNEMARLPLTMKRVLAWLQEQPWTWELLVADDGSSDGSPEAIARQFPQCRVLRDTRNRGKGAAVRRGMLAARGQLRVFTDADLSMPIEGLEGMIAALRGGGHDLVIASRALPGSRSLVPQPWWRGRAGRLFNHLVRPLSGLPFADTQCGFKLFRASAAEFLFARQQSEGWAFDVEILMLAQIYNLRVQEHPVVWSHQGASKVALFHVAPRMLKDILKYRWWRFTGRMTAEPVSSAPPVRH